jgi:uncharacterized membrane protein
VSPSANVAFSVSAAIASLAIVIASAVKGAWIVTSVFALLVVGFLLRASERYWRGDRDR